MSALSTYLIASVPTRTSAYFNTLTDAVLAPVITDTLELYGITDEADAADINKLHVLGKYVLWTFLVEHILAATPAINVGGASEYAAHVAAVERVRDYWQEQAMAYLTQNEAEVITFDTKQDPYEPVYE
jgi:hypothetical protein